MAMLARPTKQYALTYGNFRKTFNGLSQSDHLLVQLQKGSAQNAIQLWQNVREVSGIKSKRHMKKLLQSLTDRGLVRASPPPAGSRDKLFVYKALNKAENKLIVAPEVMQPNPKVEYSKFGRLSYRSEKSTAVATTTNTESTPASTTPKQPAKPTTPENTTAPTFSREFLRQKMEETRLESRRRPSRGHFLRVGLVKKKSKKQLAAEAEEQKKQQRAKAKAAEAAKKQTEEQQ